MPVCCPQVETIQLICCANQLTGFYMGATLVFNGLTCVTYDRSISPLNLNQFTFTCPKPTIETQVNDVKYVQS